MDDKGDVGNAFAIPYLLSQIPSLTLDKGWGAEGHELLNVLGKGLEIRRACMFIVNSVVTVDDKYYSRSVTKDVNGFDLCRPILESFDINTPELHYLATPDLSTTSSYFDLSLSVEVGNKDIWATPNDLHQSLPEVKARNWECFHDKKYKLPCNAYISEAGPEVFDALLNSGTIPCGNPKASKTGIDHAVKQGLLLTSLYYLVLGKASVLFEYDDSISSFVQRSGDVRISGYSLDSSHNLICSMVNRGNKTKSLTAFIDGTYSSRGSCPTLVALANAVSLIKYKLQSTICEEESQLRSVLQLQSLIREPGEILDCLSRVVQSLGEPCEDVELLFRLYVFVSREESAGSSLRSVLVELLERTSRPWLDYLSEQLGLVRGASSTSQFSHGSFLYNNQTQGPLSDRTKGFEALDHRVDAQTIPRFITEDQAKISSETTKSLQILRTFQPDHPLSRSSVAPTALHPSLEWGFSWQDIERIQDRAKNYEQSIMEAIEAYHAESFVRGSSECKPAQDDVASGVSTFGISTTVLEAKITASIEEFEKPILVLNNDDHRRPRVNDFRRSANLVDNSFLKHTAMFKPPISLTPSLSFGPTISAQARLVNRSCLRLLLEQYHLRSHLSLLHRFSLFGDGVFASRLSHALFSPDMDTAERRKDQSRSGVSGLRLGIRKSWPPAGSELRIVLMGILSEAHRDRIDVSSGPSSCGELAGGLSFAIRDISETELQKCVDPNSIEALDFLRLQYKPPPPLNMIIDASCLNKYDEIFKLLLRGQRMLYVVDQLFRDAASRSLRIRHINHKTQRFRIEAHHFVTTLYCYFVDGVETAWSSLIRRLEDVEKHLCGNYKTDIGGLHDLRAWHENMLDQIMFALLLRKRQTAVMELLEEVLNLILEFARLLQTSESSETKEHDVPNEVEDLYGEFKKKVGIFVNVCKGLIEKRGIVGLKDRQVDGRGLFDKDTVSEAGGNTIDQLLLRLNMNGYYSKPV